MNGKKQTNNIRRLYLSQDDKKIPGVCGGIAEYFRIDSSLIRLGWIIMTVVTAVIPGILAYILDAIVIPKKPSDN